MPTLEELIAVASLHKITPEEQREQIISFAYGNVHLENEEITRKDIEEAVSHFPLDNFHKLS